MDTLEKLIYHFGGAEHRSDGEHHVDCPWCQKEAKRGQTHFKFGEKGFCCHVCGKKGSLEFLWTHVSGEQSEEWKNRPRPERRPRLAPVRERPWTEIAFSAVMRNQNATDVVTLWQQYKPLPEKTIRKYRLGFGLLPCEPGKPLTSIWTKARLTVPMFGEHQEVVGVAGRTPVGRTHTPKWLEATGSSKLAWGVYELRKNCVIAICENRIDRLLTMERYPDVDVLALGGARELYDDELAAIQEARPQVVVPCLDNDLAGQAQGAFLEQLIDEEEERTGKVSRPPLFGIKIANQVLRSGLPCRPLLWPGYAPHKADLGWAVENIWGKL